jgi:hypothetical protein
MTTSEEFVAGLDHIPWFERLGQPSPRDREVFRIYDWNVWPGPEDPGSDIQQLYYTFWYDTLFEATDPKLSERLKSLWKTIHDKTFSIVRLKVPYNNAEDTWYGPNAAAGSASWLASLVGCTLARYGRLEAKNNSEVQWTLSNEWSWFVEGHWPCMYYWPWGYTDIRAAERTGVPKLLVVY